MDAHIQPRKPVVGIQVIPIDAHNPVDIIPQFSGPDKDTTGWGIYLRRSDGLAEWVADENDETTAMLLGTTLAHDHGVNIEPQPWKEKPDGQSVQT